MNDTTTTETETYRLREGWEVALTYDPKTRRYICLVPALALCADGPDRRHAKRAIRFAVHEHVRQRYLV